MTDIDDIIAKVDPDALRTALSEREAQFRAQLAELVASYRIEQANPHLVGDERVQTLERLERRMRVTAWGIGEVERRLSAAADALHATEVQPNRASRRQQAKEPARNGPHSSK